MYVFEDCLSGETLFEITEDMNAYADFDPDKIFDCGQCFRWNRQKDGSWVGVVGRNALRVYEKKGAASSAQGAHSCVLSDGTDLFHYLDLDRDYADIRLRLSSCDDKLKAACEAGAGIRILNQDPWETLISFIISQNNNIPRIKKCIEGLCSLFGERIEPCKELPGGAEFYSFPTPERVAKLSAEELSPLHLGYRDKYIIETAKRVAREEAKIGGSSANEPCPGAMRLCDCVGASERESLEYLLSLTGVGPKVANCIMLFGLRDTAAFPIDTWVRQIMNDMYGFDEKDSRGMQAFAHDRFGELAGYAQQYLFYYYREKR